MPLHIGTAGYVYSHWRNGIFYPRGLKQADELSHYVQYYSSVEINATWHAFPRIQTLAKWRSAARSHTNFALKAPKLITHDKRFRDTTLDVISFCQTATDGLGNHLGPLLFQCPPTFSLSIALLQSFLDDIRQAREACKRHIQIAVEFRHPAWYCEQVYALLHSHDVALVQNVHVSDDDFTREKPQMHLPLPDKYRLSWSYTRFHGSKAPHISTNFPDNVLRPYVRQVVSGIKSGSNDHFVFFLNDLDALATKNARRFAELVAEEGAMPLRDALGGFVPKWKNERSIKSFFTKAAPSQKSNPSPLRGRTKGSSSAAASLASPSSAKVAPASQRDSIAKSNVKVSSKPLKVVGGVQKNVNSNKNQHFFFPKTLSKK